MEWLGIAGVMASALGLALTLVFGGYAFLVNGPRTREMIREMHADTQRTLEKMDDTLRYLADLIRAEGERTREETRTRRA